MDIVIKLSYIDRYIPFLLKKEIDQIVWITRRIPVVVHDEAVDIRHIPYIVYVFQSSLVVYIIFICYQLSRKSNPVMGMEESFNACKTKSNAHVTYICIDFSLKKTYL